MEYINGFFGPELIATDTYEMENYSFARKLVQFLGVESQHTRTDRDEHIQLSLTNASAEFNHLGDSAFKKVCSTFKMVCSAFEKVCSAFDMVCNAFKMVCIQYFSKHFQKAYLRLPPNTKPVLVS